MTTAVRVYPAERLSFRLLGTLDAWSGTGQVALGHAKQQAVLATLLLRNGQAVSRDHLIDALWGDDPPRSAANVIQTYIARLRKALEPAAAGQGPRQALRTCATGYLLNVAPTCIDVSVFEQELIEADEAHRSGNTAGVAAVLRSALGRWQGTALDGLPGPGLATERQRLGELRWSAFERYAQAELALGRTGMLIAELSAATSEQPFRERLWGYLMLALAKAGRRGEALAAYQRSRSLLRAELGMEPGAELRRIHQAILAGEESAGSRPARRARSIQGKLQPG